MTLRKSQFLFFLMALALFGATSVFAQANKAAGAQKTFPTAEDAAKAYVAACEQGDTAALESLLGPGSDEIINSGDETQDKHRRERFAALAKESLEVRTDPYNYTNSLVYVGKRQWPLPIPIIKDGDVYRFDVTGARTDILARRIGQNELNAINFLQQIAQAQIDFAYADQKMVGIREYAQTIRSQAGQHNGLYWDAADGQAPSPLSDAITKAMDQGYELPPPGDPFLYHGYIYRILLSQGPNAPGGAREYVVRGKMMGGFAAIAYPVEYGVTGVKTFIVNQDGNVLERDLGDTTTTSASALKIYNPDKSWNDAPREEAPEMGASSTKP